MKKFISNPILILALIAIVFTSCKKKKDDPAPVNEEEEITMLKMVLTEKGTNKTYTLYYKDLDGPGGNEPEANSDNIYENTEYDAVITLFNGDEEITQEIVDEADEHQFFFSSQTIKSTFTYADKDKNDKPIGLKTTLKTGEAVNGLIKITLRHQPDKNGANVSTGDITNAGGSTDLEASIGVFVIKKASSDEIP